MSHLWSRRWVWFEAKTGEEHVPSGQAVQALHMDGWMDGWMFFFWFSEEAFCEGVFLAGRGDAWLAGFQLPPPAILFFICLMVMMIMVYLVDDFGDCVC